MDNHNNDTESTLFDAQAKASRRSFLKKAGKLAIYTPPAMMVLMKPSHATFNTSFDVKDGQHKRSWSGGSRSWSGGSRSRSRSHRSRSRSRRSWS